MTSSELSMSGALSSLSSDRDFSVTLTLDRVTAGSREEAAEIIEQCIGPFSFEVSGLRVHDDARDEFRASVWFGEDGEEDGGEEEEGRASAVKDWSLLRAQMKFDRLDVDGSGYLEGDEVLTLAEWVWSSFHPENVPLSPRNREELAAKLLRRLDTNHDGRMSFVEFSDWFKKTVKSISQYRHTQKGAERGGS